MANTHRIRNKTALLELVDGLIDERPVSGLTHNYYRYPARFSPRFAGAAILAFSKPGEVVLDPFVGGGTTLVEARALGRHGVGCDVNSLSVFLSYVKTTLLSDRDLKSVEDWIDRLPQHVNLHLSAKRATSWQHDGYQRYVPWPIRKTLELALAQIDQLPRTRQQRFVRCLLLKAGQWALDCRERVPSAAEFRKKLPEHLSSFVGGMREFREAVHKHPTPGSTIATTTSLHCRAAELPNAAALDALPSRPRLVVTSPPYPGVYVLYHRWKVQGRKESPAPFWVADCLDGQGQAHYCFGHRKQRGLKTYFDGIRSSFAGVRRVIDPEALVVQMVAFAEPKWQVPRFMESMNDAGFEEVAPGEIGIPRSRRLWRAVPGRRWFALIHGPLATSREVVLFHKLAR